MSDTLKTVAVAAAIIIAGLFAVSAIFGAMPASELVTVDNETITADVGGTTQVSEDYGESYYDNESITNSSDTELVDGTDYEWNTDNGTVSWFDTANVSDGEQMSISYALDAKPAMARNSVGVVATAFELVALAVIALTAGLVLASAGVLGGGGRRGRL